MDIRGFLRKKEYQVALALALYHSKSKKDDLALILEHHINEADLSRSKEVVGYLERTLTKNELTTIFKNLLQKSDYFSAKEVIFLLKGKDKEDFQNELINELCQGGKYSEAIKYAEEFGRTLRKEELVIILKVLSDKLQEDSYPSFPVGNHHPLNEIAQKLLRMR